MIFESVFGGCLRLKKPFHQTLDANIRHIGGRNETAVDPQRSGESGSRPVSFSGIGPYVMQCTALEVFGLEAFGGLQQSAQVWYLGSIGKVFDPA
jgi:hypothetical protein